MFRSTAYRARVGQVAVCALVLGFAPGAALAQSRLEQPTLTPPAAVAPERAIEKVVLDAAVLFDFGSFTLRPEGRVALDQFVGSLSGASLGVIRAVGHADRLGPEAQNQILSEERAESVKAYLVSRGIGESRVRAEGRGAAQPATKRGACAGAGSVRLISCLQPDRRAGVEVAGTRPSDGPAIR